MKTLCEIQPQNTTRSQVCHSLPSIPFLTQACHSLMILSNTNSLLSHKYASWTIGTVIWIPKNQPVGALAPQLRACMYSSRLYIKCIYYQLFTTTPSLILFDENALNLLNPSLSDCTRFMRVELTPNSNIHWIASNSEPTDRRQ